jgi:hypothetical protein
MRQGTQRDRLLMRWGATKAKAGRAATLVTVRLPGATATISAQALSVALPKE